MIRTRIPLDQLYRGRPEEQLRRLLNIASCTNLLAGQFYKVTKKLIPLALNCWIVFVHKVLLNELDCQRRLSYAYDCSEHDGREDR